MIAARIQDEFNRHINQELYSSYVYLSMAAWCDSQGLRGFAHWMHEQSREEQMHVMKFYHFLLDRGGAVKLDAIEAPPQTWESPLHVFEDALAHEQHVSKGIHRLVDTVLEERDHAANVFLNWFVNEQVEEEATVSEVVDRLKLVGNDGRGILLIDQELSARSAAGGNAAGA